VVLELSLIFKVTDLKILLLEGTEFFFELYTADRWLWQRRTRKRIFEALARLEG